MPLPVDRIAGMASRGNVPPRSLRRGPEETIDFRAGRRANGPHRSAVSWNIPDDTVDFSEKCGPFGMECLRSFATFPVLRFLLFIAAFSHGYIVNGLISTSITSIERRFNLSTLDIGKLTIMYDGTFMIGLVVMLIFPKGVNKSMMIGFGMWLIGMGSFLLASPHFFAAPYMSTFTPFNCQQKMQVLNECTKQDSSIDLIFSVMVASMALLGFGAAPLFTYGFTCLDDFDSQKNLVWNTALFVAASVIGPAVGYVSSKPILSTWGEFYRSNYEEFEINGTADPRWYGAWYIGFIAGGCLSIMVAILLCCFPRKLNDTRERRRGHKPVFDNSLNVNLREKNTMPFGEYWLFLKNITCMGLVVMFTLQAVIVHLYLVFVPMLLENLLRVSTANGGLWAGVLIVTTGFVGNFIGGRLLHHLYKRFHQNLRKLLCVAIGGLLICILGSTAFLFHCPSIKLAGVNVPYNVGDTNLTLINPCNIKCSCDRLYNPICNVETGTTYHSPCHAGCQIAHKWTDCSCINDYSMEMKIGFCDTECGQDKLVLFLGLLSILALMMFIVEPIVRSSSIQIVPFQLRDCFQYFSWFFMRLLGSIPGTYGFGRLVDSTCLLWNVDCNGNNSSCRLYDSEEMGLRLFYLTVAIEVSSVFCLLFVIFSYKNVQDVRDALSTGFATDNIREIEYQSEDDVLEEEGREPHLYEMDEAESDVSMRFFPVWSYPRNPISPAGTPFSTRRTVHGSPYSQRSIGSITPRTIRNIPASAPTVRKAHSDNVVKKTTITHTRSAMKSRDDTYLETTKPHDQPAAPRLGRREMVRAPLADSDASLASSVLRRTSSKKDD